MYRKKTKKPQKTSSIAPERVCTFKKIDFPCANLNSFNSPLVEVIVTQGGRNFKSNNNFFSNENNNKNTNVLQNCIMSQNNLINECYDPELQILKEKEMILKTIWYQLERFTMLEMLTKNECEVKSILKRPIILKAVDGEI